jgi:hypothetical protein
MRHTTVSVGLAVLLLATGCNNGTRFPGLVRSSQPPRVPTETPTAAMLVDYLNRNSRQIQTLEVRDLAMDCKQKLQPVGLQGQMVCQKPRSFRLGAKVLGNQAVDMGSNDQEFWYWISKAEPPYLYHCSYADFARGVRMPFPFQPEWIMEALGMGEYGPAEDYQVVVHPETVDLVHWTKSPQGQQVKKITVFDRKEAATVRVRDYVLQDAQGREIYAAHVTEVQQVGAIIVPKRVRLVWPAEQIELKLKLDEVQVNRQLNQDQTVRLFTRPHLANIPSYDLARGLDGAPNGVRAAGGFPR